MQLGMKQNRRWPSRLGLRLPASEGPFFYPASFDARASDYWNTVMKFDDNSRAADISALKEIIAGTSADPLTVKQLVNSDWSKN
jgi:hypothetical protein